MLSFTDVGRYRWRLAAVLVVGCASFDFITYHYRHRAAMGVVRSHGGRCGSLWGWPLGHECCITFSSPLGREALASLTILNSLAPRSAVAVWLNYPLSDRELQRVRDVLQECAVARVADSD